MANKYFYKAMDSRGRIIQGEVSAANISDLEYRLERMGLDLIQYRTKKVHHFHVNKVSRVEMITFCFHMEQLTRAGVPILSALEDLRDSLPQSRFREVIASLIESIQGGENLSEAMHHFPEVFNRVFTSLVHAGEESGNLSVVFQHLTETLKWQDELIAKTKKLVMYPTFVGIVILAVMMFLMIYLVPKLITFIQMTGGELPLHTQILLLVSNFFVDYWFIILSLPVAAFFALKFAMRLSMGLCFFIDRLKLRLWLIGPILEKIILARFANFFALLYGSGITVLESLEISKGVVGNLVIEAALQQVIEQIRDGVGISESFYRVRLFPPLVLRMVQIGEATGELDTSLRNVSYFYNREVKESIEKIQTLIEPAMTVIMGLLLGWIMVSVLGPIYDMITDFVK